MMLKARGVWALIGLWVSLAWTLTASAYDDPKITWITLESDHFALHLPLSLKPLAMVILNRAEQGYALLSQHLAWKVDQKIEMVLRDDVDAANGSAQVVPYALIQLYASAPLPRSTLDDHDGWLRILLYHELVHILHLSTVLGWPAKFNQWFGKVLFPNGLLPKWYIEGLAVYFESHYTGGGRVKNALFKMQLRMASWEGRFLDLGQLNGIPVQRPWAGAWYLYGAFFLNDLAQTYGESALNRFHRYYGRTLIPFGINKAAYKAFGDSFVHLYQKWKAKVHGQSWADWVKFQAFRSFDPPVTVLGRGWDHPRVRPGTHDLSFYWDDGDRLPVLGIFQSRSGQVKVLERHFGDGRHDWAPDGRTLVFSEFSHEPRIKQYRDLFIYEMDGGEKRALTHGLRAREPSYSPDGKSIVFVRAREGCTDLAVYHLDTHEVEVLYRGEIEEQIATPVWHPKGRWIVVARSVGRPLLQRDLWVFDLNSRKWHALWQDRAQDIEPRFDQEGQWLYWSSDRSGVYEIYAYRWSDGEIRQMTHAYGGHFNPFYDDEEKRLYWSSYHSDGYELCFMEIEDPSQRPKLIGEYKRSWPPKYLESEVEISESLYKPWQYLWPYTWLPTWTGDVQGALWGLSVSGYDPVGHHLWSGNWYQDGPTGDWDFSMAYAYGGLPVDLYASMSRWIVHPKMRVESQWKDWDRQDWNFSIGGRYLWPFQGSSHAWSLTAKWARHQTLSGWHWEHDPLDLKPIYPHLGDDVSLSAAWSYSSIERSAFGFSQEGGWQFNTSLSMRWPWLRLGDRWFEVRHGISKFLLMPWSKHQVFGVKLSGAWSWSDGSSASSYGIGGMPSQDLMSALFDWTEVYGDRIRGYDAYEFWDHGYELWSLEYRFPIADIGWGYGTLPVDLQRLHGVLFSDGGIIWGGEDGMEMAFSMGTELRLSWMMSYNVAMMFRLGWAHGFGSLGKDQFYLVSGWGF